MSTMTRMLVLSFFAVYLPIASAQTNPPSPGDIANTVSNMWMSSQINDLGAYITNLYGAYSNYVPAILASSFYDYIYRGDLRSASNKLWIIEHSVTNNLVSYTNQFPEKLSIVRRNLDEEIAMHQSMGITDQQLQSNASPQTIRSEAGTLMLPAMYILFCAPATNAP